MGQFTRYLPLVMDLARRALARGGEEVPAAHPASRGSRQRRSAALAAPAARGLVNEADPTGLSLLPGLEHFLETRGPLSEPLDHPRDVDHLLALHLLVRPGRKRETPLPPEVRRTMERVARAWLDRLAVGGTAALNAAAGESFALRLWKPWVRLRLADRIGGSAGEAETSAVEAVLSQPGVRGSLHPQAPTEPMDTWTWSELTGLHALAGLAERMKREDWRRRVREAAAFHVEHTQPDYVTHQPWALAAFAGEPATAPFAEQQLHDADTRLHGGEADAGRMIGLLLADAAESLARSCGGGR